MVQSKIQQLLSGRNEEIDYDKIIQNNSWIVSENQNCIISPDSDGILCGLFMSNYLNWNIVGFYDGKVLILKKGLSAKECIFLDMEVFRKDIKSMGHHMMLFNKRHIPFNWSNLKNCIQPNVMRNYDANKDFRLKYPLATIHMLLGIVSHKLNIKVPDSSIPAMFFTDGAFNVLFKYPENVLNWLAYLKAHEKNSPLKGIFENTRYSVFTLMQDMDIFFRERDKISIQNERGDRLRISKTDGSPFNLVKKGDIYVLNNNAIRRIEDFIGILSKLTGWEYDVNKWLWTNFSLYKFTKRDFKKDKKNLNTRNFNDFIMKNPLSFAITGRGNLEYTLETPDTLP